MKRKKIYGIFMLVAIAVFLFAGGRILQIYLNYQESQKVYEQMEGFTQKIEDQDLSPEAVPGETPGDISRVERNDGYKPYRSHVFFAGRRTEAYLSACL